MRDFDQVRRLPADTRACLAFFSRLPVTVPPGAFELGRAAGAFPVAGLVIAVGPAAALALLSAAGAPEIVAAGAALALLVLVTGGLHEDGLADSFDGLGAVAARAGRLAVMRDSRIGTYGALALAFTILLRAGALGALALDPGNGAAALLLSAGLSRAFALWHWRALPPARTDGLAAAAGRPTPEAVELALASAAVLALLSLVAFGRGGLLGLALGGLATLLFNRHARQKLAGHTGDTIGAAQQLSETALLVGFSTSWFSAVAVGI
ncbi:adenosylcobinamide-GDP ribazoletransferase [Propylenella binzhouense]|uniref:Adenosylcobinamide-GDP ribazoletransferase n=1 Tax=Propylenella binzhouense TaxID=2555902 RepID=A0A964WSR7_9HYPH|nr:adenosylcobinamide-GDP ribazoletransferase [Propylenella binzhouense]MYZ47166.1 adenosylcobinamide-GDP ribazoletransferase [Propylenella binzhouense]